MPKIRGKRLGVIHRTASISKAYRDKLVFDNRVPVGYTMWSGPKAFMASSDLTNRHLTTDVASTHSLIALDEMIELKKPISKLRDGIEINGKGDVQLYHPSGGNSYTIKSYDSVPYPTLDIGNVKIDAETLLKRQSIKLFSYAAYDIEVKMMDDTHIQLIERGNVSNVTVGNSTCYNISYPNTSTNSSVTLWYAIIDSITAY